MKIGIFGANSYIGTMFGSTTLKEGSHEIFYINSFDNQWMDLCFKNYDVILLAAGIAHVTKNHKYDAQYLAINRDLPIQVAQKAKAEGVTQFIFLSSMIVYGDITRLGETITITKNTEPMPTNIYGRSKLEAEAGLCILADEKFTVSIIRTPMVYGQGCKGNFPKLVSIACKLPIFPDLNNRRSMIYIDNLCAYLKIIIDGKIGGILFPQNTEYINTKDIVSQTARFKGNKIHFTKIFNSLLVLFSTRIGLIRKLFGSKIYCKELSPNMESYNIYSFEISMKRFLKLGPGN